MRQPVRRRASSTGYTVVELVIVIAVLGIVASFAAPRFFSKQPFDERAYADAIAGALRATQRAAVATGCPARLQIDSAGFRARLPAAAGNACDPTDASWSTPVPLPDGSTVEATAAAPVSPASSSITFLPSGATAAAAPTLAVGPWRISVDATTGYVAIQRS
jgi:MSHA pilin protein MshC